MKICKDTRQGNCVIRPTYTSTLPTPSSTTCLPTILGLIGFSTWEHLVKAFLQVGGARKGYLRRTSVKAVSTLDLRYMGPNLGLMLALKGPLPPSSGHSPSHRGRSPKERSPPGAWASSQALVWYLEPRNFLPKRLEAASRTCSTPYAHHEILDVGRWLLRGGCRSKLCGLRWLTFV